MNPHKLLLPVTIILSVIFASYSGRPEPKLRIGVSQCSSDDWRNKIKALTGISPVELLRDMRLREARRLLTTTELSISEIAYEADFSTPAYFTKMFPRSLRPNPVRAPRLTFGFPLTFGYGQKENQAPSQAPDSPFITLCLQLSALSFVSSSSC